MNIAFFLILVSVLSLLSQPAMSSETGAGMVFFELSINNIIIIHIYLFLLLLFYQFLLPRGGKIFLLRIFMRAHTLFIFQASSTVWQGTTGHGVHQVCFYFFVLCVCDSCLNFKYGFYSPPTQLEILAFVFCFEFYLLFIVFAPTQPQRYPR